MSVMLGETKISDIIKTVSESGGTSNYNDLINKPAINGVILENNKTTEDLNITAESINVYTKDETIQMINNLTSSKANISYVDGQLATKADTSYVNNQLALKANSSDVYTKEEIPTVIQQNTSTKADTSYVNEQLNLKADKSNTYTKDETDTAISEVASTKTDTSYVNTQLNLKADKADTYTKDEVDSAIDVVSSGIDAKIATKANASDVYTKTEANEKISEATSTKADTSYVNEQLALKSDKDDTYTKEEIDNFLDNPTITGDTLPIGSMLPFSGQTVPENWLLCDGREVSRTTYSQLFAVIGTIYGDGDGTTSFNLPDSRDKFPVGAGGDIALAATGGEKEHTLTVEEMPSHSHGFEYGYGYNQSTTKTQYFIGTNNKDGSITYQDYIKSTGGGQAHNNMPPYIGQYYIIKAKQSAGVVATVVDTLESSSTTDALSANQGKVLADLIPVILYEDDKTYSEIANNTNITLSDDITNYKRAKVFGISKGGHLMSTEIYNPEINDKFTLHYGNPGGRTGMYAYEHYYRMFTFTDVNKIKYNEGTYLTSKIVSSASPVGFVSDLQLIKIYAVIGFKK